MRAYRATSSSVKDGVKFSSAASKSDGVTATSGASPSAFVSAPKSSVRAFSPAFATARFAARIHASAHSAYMSAPVNVAGTADARRDSKEARETDGTDAKNQSRAFASVSESREKNEKTFPQPEWLWRFLSRASAHDRALFLKFVTGSSRLPPGGIASLRHALTVVRAPLGDGHEGERSGFGTDADPEAPGAERGAPGDARTGEHFRRATRRRGENEITKIRKTNADPKRFPLPTAATCFNQLRLPEYPSEAVLQHRVATALRHGVEGFSFG